MAMDVQTPRRAAPADTVIEGDEGLVNTDLAPVPLSKRNWTWFNYAALWLGMIHSVFGFTVVGGLIVTGLSPIQALIVVSVANLIQLAFLSLNGRVGSRYGIPFPVWARSAYGIYGANVPALLRGAVAIGWFGVQSYLGATAVNALLTTVFGPWKGLGGTALFGLGLNLWFSMLIFWAVNFLVIWHGMNSIRRFETFAGPAVIAVMVPLVIWSLVSAHGIGPLFSTPSKYSTSGFLTSALLPGVALFISAAWATMILNIPDLTRFARSNRDATLGTFIGLPLGTLIFYAMAAIIVSGTQAVFGKALWNPSDILLAINNPVLTVVGALLITFATLSVNIAANLVSPAYDLTNLLPKIFNFRRAAVVGILLSFVYMPWRLMQTPATLFSVLGNIGAVLGPATGIIMADYFVVRRRLLDVPELYKVNGRYRSFHGFNLISLGWLVVLSGIIFVGEAVPSIGWLYTYSWFVGEIGGFVGYLAIVYLVKAVRKGLPTELEPVGSPGLEAVEAAPPAVVG
jgi:nucleobase:cation symporter-1, NCS1 family